MSFFSIKRGVLFITTFITLLFTSYTLAADNTKVEFTTNKGNFVIALNQQKAPKTVANFLHYVDNNFYDGLTFHRVIKGFMVQAGGFDENLKPKTLGISPIINEADNKLKNKVGTIAMARTSDPHSATSQFFINTAKNDFLNHTGKSNRGWGYTVFGEVISGMDVVREIENSRTDYKNGMKDVPTEPVIITHVKRLAN